jgi:hypothetical protein
MMRCLRVLFGSASSSSSSSNWPLHAFISPLQSCQVVQAALRVSTVTTEAFHTTSSAAADQPAGQQSSLTEEQLAGLFDEELQHRLEAAARQARTHPASHLAAEHAPGSTSTSTSSGLPPPAPQQAARVFQQHAAPAVWHPLLSADPWAPLPTAAHSRCAHSNRLAVELQSCLAFSSHHQHPSTSLSGHCCCCPVPCAWLQAAPPAAAAATAAPGWRLRGGCSRRPCTSQQQLQQ